MLSLRSQASILMKKSPGSSERGEANVVNPLNTIEAAIIMKQQKAVQDQSFYSVYLESHVPQIHLLRAIDRVLDLGDLHL